MVRDLLKGKEMFQIDLYSLHAIISKDIGSVILNQRLTNKFSGKGRSK